MFKEIWSTFQEGLHINVFGLILGYFGLDFNVYIINCYRRKAYNNVHTKAETMK